MSLCRCRLFDIHFVGFLVEVSRNPQKIISRAVSGVLREVTTMLCTASELFGGLIHLLRANRLTLGSLPSEKRQSEMATRWRRRRAT